MKVHHTLLAVLIACSTSGAFAAKETISNSALNAGAVAPAVAPPLSAPMANVGASRPSGPEATVIQGVNTAGTVRVSNLANLESYLNIVANVGEIAGVLIGGIFMLGALTRTQDSTKRRIINAVIGIVIGAAGLSLVGVINSLLMSTTSCGDFFS